MSEPPPAPPFELEKLFTEHQGRIFRAAYRITGNAQDAEDVLQTIFLRLANRGGGAALVNSSSYLYRSAVNAALDLLRSRRESVALEEAEAPAGDRAPDPPDRTHEAAEMRSRLRRALTRLSPQAAEVFTLRYLEGHDNRDIARMLGLSRVLVAVTLHRARHRLQKELRDMGEER